MSLFGAATWLAAGILVFGALAVFGWFLRDVVRLWRDRPDRER